MPDRNQPYNRKSARPNVLLLVADQHRLDCLGAYGRFAGIRTPNLDRLAAGGAFFEHAFTPNPVCSPARQALLSGLAPDSYGGLWNPDFLATPTLQPSPDFYTAALARAGYTCSLVGKWNTSLTHLPVDFGFAEHIDYDAYHRLMAERYATIQWQERWFGEASPIPLEDSKTHWAARQVCGLVRQRTEANEPWLIRLDFTDPHLPCRPSEPFASLIDPEQVEPWDSFGDTLEGKPYIQRQQLVNWDLVGKTWSDWRRTVAFYYGMIAQIDDAVGLMLDQLAALGIERETIVVYTSDHGDLCGGHGMIDKHYTLYDDVTRVPLIIRYPDYPGQLPAGRRIGEYVSNCLDIGATLAELCGLPDVDPGAGISLAPLLRGESQTQRDFAVSSANGQQFGLFTQRCIRTDQWLYVWNLTDTDELYAVEQDPGQKVNRIQETGLSAALAELRQRLHAELIRRGDPFARTFWLEGQLLHNRKL